MMLERIVARRVELEEQEERRVKQLAEVRVEWDELVVAERVVQRISEQGFGEYLSLAPAPVQAQVGGQSVLLIPVRAGDIGPEVLPADYQRILAIVREAAGPVKVKEVGAALGTGISCTATTHTRTTPDRWITDEIRPLAETLTCGYSEVTIPVTGRHCRTPVLSQPSMKGTSCAQDVQDA
ncbi:hypothetical protein [Streptomyces sp. NPDC050564]|uniref:hypothetical protein n=1 Tax=Streptomyces sp. NPDC050564 TaxID=3365631 RepID=UPI0037A2DF64